MRRWGQIGRAAAAGVIVAGAAPSMSCVLAYPARASVGAAPAELAAESVRIPSGSGSTLRGWLSMGRPGGGAVLLLHGVRANRRAMLDRARFLHARGYAVLLPDLQAHGESPGRRVTFGALESADAAAAIAYLRARAPRERVGVIGVSMGGAAVLVGEGPVDADAYVLESVYPTIHHAVTGRLRAWLGPLGSAGPALAPLLVRLVGPRIGVSAADLRPIDRIARLAAPVLVAAGTADRYTTLAESRALYAAARSPKVFWPVDGAGHEDLHAFARRAYERRVGDFLAAHLRTASAGAAPPAPGGGRR
jgi:fermentation-respiration switch protein FrsA (DUF1100 family)